MPKDQVETTLADLAVNLVFDRTPGLADHYLGFEVIPGSQNEEKTRAAGLLGFRVGTEELYIPILFLNGKVKGSEVIYLSDADVFTSNSKQWIDYLTTRDTGVMGGGATPKTPLQQPSSQGLAVFSRNPGSIGKMGSAFFDGAAQDFWNKVASANENWTEITLGENFTLPNVLKSLGKEAYLKFAAFLDENPAVLSKMAQHFDIEKEVLFDWPTEKKASAQDEEDAIIQKVASVVAEFKGPLFLLAEEVENLSDSKTASILSLSAEQKEQCFTDGYIVLDKRAASEKSLVLKNDYRNRFSAPTESGFYEVLSASGEIERVFLAHQAFTIERPEKRMPGSLFLDPESGVFVLPVIGEQVFIRSRLSTDEAVWKEKASKMPAVSSMEPNKSYMLISSKMDVSIPFRVKGKTKSKDGLSFVCETPWDLKYRCMPLTESLYPSLHCVSGGSSDAGTALIRIVDREDESSVARVGNITYIPSSWKVIEVYDDSTNLHWGHSTYPTDSETEKAARKEREEKAKVYFRILPGNSQTLTSVLANKNIHELTVHKTASDYFVRIDKEIIGSGSKIAAMQALVSGLGIGADDAAAIIDESISSAGTKQWVKKASVIERLDASTINAKLSAPIVIDVTSDPKLLKQSAKNESPGDVFERLLNKSARGPSLNGEGLIYGGMAFPEDDQDVGATSQGVRETGSTVSREQVPMNNMGDETQDWRNMDEANWDKIQQRDMDFLMRAADSGSKPVFESSIINLLLKTNRTSDQVSEWLPDLVNSLDSKCRLLLLFYWHSADFSESYGKDEMAEFEDVLLNSIKIDGQLVLFLKQKSSESSSSKIDAFAG